MLKAVLIDDEASALESLSWELENFTNEIVVAAKFTSPEEAISYLNKNTCDCIFLDIDMPTMDGFQFLKELKTKDFAVIITTAYNEYAIKALKEEALDYLLKPVDADDLKLTIVKVKKFLTRTDITSQKLEHLFLQHQHSQKIPSRIPIQTDGKLIFLETDSILFVESDGNYSTMYTEKDGKILLTKKLKEVHAILPETLFLRVHNSYVVNLQKIKEYIKSEGYIVLSSNHKLPISRQRKSAFLERL